MSGLTVEQSFEAWLRSVCFQKPTPEAYDLAKCAWLAALSERGGEQKPVGYLDWPALTFRFNGTVERIGPMPVNAEPIPLYTRPQAGMIEELNSALLDVMVILRHAENKLQEQIDRLAVQLGTAVQGDSNG